MRSIRSLLNRELKLNRKLRRAVVRNKARQVADLLDAGASPTWMDEAVDPTDQMNALLLACHHGHTEILDLLLDSFFETPQMLSVWGRHMYHVVIRNGHWKAFRRIYDRKVPTDPQGSMRSMLPTPAFVAAEHGQSRMLQFLVKDYPRDYAGYSFNGHSLLSIASKNGHYECVELLLSLLVPNDETMDFAIEVARMNSQAHVLVLLTSCLPQYHSNPEPLLTVRRPSVTVTVEKDAFAISELSSLVQKEQRRSGDSNHRGSLAETDIISDCGDEDPAGRASMPELRRRSSAWLYQSDHDLQVYHPYLEGDADELAYDIEAARRYEAYIRGLEDDEAQDWTTTPPVPFFIPPRSRRTLSMESEEKTEETLARIAERREAMKKEQKKVERKKNWFYCDEVILPYEESEDSMATTDTSATPNGSFANPPRSAKPSLPPPSNQTIKSFRMPTVITQVSRKLVNIRSKQVQVGRASI